MPSQKSLLQGGHADLIPLIGAAGGFLEVWPGSWITLQGPSAVLDRETRLCGGISDRPRLHQEGGGHGLV